MKSLQDIQSLLYKEKSRLFSSYPLKSMAIFGSFSKQEHTPHSDIDILVEFSDTIGIRFVDLAEDLESIVGTKVDLVSKNGIKEKYYNQIKADLLYV